MGRPDQYAKDCTAQPTPELSSRNPVTAERRWDDRRNMRLMSRPRRAGLPLLRRVRGTGPAIDGPPPDMADDPGARKPAALTPEPGTDTRTGTGSRVCTGTGTGTGTQLTTP